MLLDETKLSALLERLEAMLVLQRPKPARLRARIDNPAPYGNSWDLRTSLKAIECEVSMLEDITGALRDAGVRLSTDDDIVRPGAASDDYGASGEEVADFHYYITQARPPVRLEIGHSSDIRIEGCTLEQCTHERDTLADRALFNAGSDDDGR